MPNNKKLLLMILAVFLTTALSAQRFKDLMEAANTEYELHAFNRAIVSYKKALGRRSNDPEALGKLADCYRHLNQMEEAARWYADAIDQRKADPIYTFQYGLVLKALGRYNEAISMFLEYSRTDPGVGSHYAKSCNFALLQQGVSSNYLVRNELVNTSASDFGATLNGQQVIFSSARMDIQRTSSNWTGNANNQLFVSRIGPNGYLDQPYFLKSDIRNVFNEGPVSFSPDGKWVAYTKNNFVDGTRQIPSSGLELSLFIAEVNQNGDWVNPRPFTYNMGYSTGYPCFSPDGKALYFASQDRPNGLGGYDVYVSYGSGHSWSSPENVGTVINSPGNEITPFHDGANLFFSSDWHHGFGGFDIFRAEKSEVSEQWINIFHLEKEVNSSYDDYDFSYDRIKNIGYLTSNRPGGKGHEDIYKVFKAADNIVLRVKNAADGSPVSGAIIDFSNCDEGVFRADDKGVYSFQAVSGLNCSVVIRKEGFVDKGFTVSTTGMRQNREYEIMLNKTGEQYRGKIVSFSNRQPVSGVRVAATNQATNSVVEVTTDVNGDYALALSPNTLYVLRYSRPGYRDFNRTVKTGEVVDPTLLGVVSILPATGTVAGVGQPTVGNPPGQVLNPRETGGTPGGNVPPPSTISSGYAVQIAALSSPRLEEFSSLMNIGQVYSKQDRSIYKIRVGIFPTRGQAESALTSIRRRGYPEAFIVPETGGAPATTIRNPGAGTQPPTSVSPAGRGGDYKVQLAAYRDARWFDPSKLAPAGGVVEERQRDGWTVKYLGGFSTLQQAQNALRIAQSAGFNGAFIVRDENGTLVKVR